MSRADGSASIVGMVGHGVTGRRIEAMLAETPTPVAVFERTVPSTSRQTVDVVALCQPHPHAELAAEFLAAGTPVVSMSADLDDVRELLDLDSVAERHGSALIVGAAMSPGLSGLLVDHLWRQLDVAEEIHVATHGTAGPACAAQHHDALGDTAIGWHDGGWIERPGGSGRELGWFPGPIGAKDCYRAALPDPILLHRNFPSAMRISARVSGTRRDRLTARLPMLTPPHAAGDIGAVRVEVRGALGDGTRETLIAGASGRTADIAGAVMVACLEACLDGSIEPGLHLVGGPTIDSSRLLPRVIDLGVRLEEFTGVASAWAW